MRLFNQTKIINERPVEFPTVTILDNNPFTTKIAQDLAQNVTLNRTGDLS